MANTASYWKNIIGNFYIDLTAVKILYSLTDSDVSLGFDSLFSKASVESVLFYAMGYGISIFEKVLDAFRVEIQTKIDGSYIANKEWWHAQALKFQKGDDLLLDSTTFIWKYETVNEENKLIKRVAVRESPSNETPCKVKLYVAKDDALGLGKLTVDDLALFAAYTQRIKPAGVLVDCFSEDGDIVAFIITCNYNPLLLDNEGKLISGDTYPVTDATNDFITHLNTTNFGGKLNLTKLIDTIQAATGVVDARITFFSQNGIEKETWGTFESVSGWFMLDSVTVNYQPQTEL